MFLRPFSELIVPATEFLADLLNAEHRALSVRLAEPFPEAGSDVKGVVAVLRLDEDVGVYEVLHASPALSASPSKVECLTVPNNR